MMCVHFYDCPICGYDGLTEIPWEDDSPSYEICPSCGNEFGNDDFSLDPLQRAHLQEELRVSWEQAGRPWFSRTRLPSVESSVLPERIENDGA
jgi:hypothetical protein